MVVHMFNLRTRSDENQSIFFAYWLSTNTRTNQDPEFPGSWSVWSQIEHDPFRTLKAEPKPGAQEGSFPTSLSNFVFSLNSSIQKRFTSGVRADRRPLDLQEEGVARQPVPHHRPHDVRRLRERTDRQLPGEQIRFLGQFLIPF